MNRQLSGSCFTGVAMIPKVIPVGLSISNGLFTNLTVNDVRSLSASIPNGVGLSLVFHPAWTKGLPQALEQRGNGLAGTRPEAAETQAQHEARGGQAVADTESARRGEPGEKVQWRGQTRAGEAEAPGDLEREWQPAKGGDAGRDAFDQCERVAVGADQDMQPVVE